MAHIYRFFGTKQSSNNWQLEEEEAHHALKVLRLSDGDHVEVMDGLGAVASGRLRIESKSKVFVTSTEEFSSPKDLFTRYILMGALKPGDVDDVIAPLTELGVDKLIIFRQADTAQFRVSDSAIERWQRLARSAAKQSKRAYVLEINCTQDMPFALGLVNEVTHRWILEPTADVDLLSAVATVRSGSGIAVLIGGEKGLSEAETLQATRQGFKPVRLGRWILRAQTAAQAAAVFLGMMPRP